MDTEINVIDARDMIYSSEEGKDLQLVDVRPKESFEKQSLEGFINIPLNEISRRFQNLDAKKKTLLICQDGSLSQKALKLLESCGFKAQVIRGGLDDWDRIITISKNNDA